MKKIMNFAIAFAVAFFFGISSEVYASDSKTPVVGIAWRADIDNEFLTNVERAVEAAGGKWVLLDQVWSADLSYDGNGHLTGGVDKLGALTAESAKHISIG